MSKYLRGLYSILNYVSENQFYFVNNMEYGRQIEHPKKIKGIIKWDDDWKNFDVLILEDYFYSLLNDIYRDVFDDEFCLKNFIPWLDRNKYLPYGLDDDKNVNPCIAPINGIPSLCICVRVNVSSLKTKTLNK